MFLLIGKWLSEDGGQLTMSSLETLLDAAFDAYNQGEFEHAETLARDVLNAEPAHGDALYLLGLIASCRLIHKEVGRITMTAPHLF